MYLCRLCGLSIIGKKVDLFRGKKPHQTAIRIRNYLKVKVHPTDGLPQYICEACQIRVNDIHTFISRVHDTQYYLITEMGNLKHGSVGDHVEESPKPEPVRFVKEKMIPEPVVAKKKSPQVSQNKVSTPRASRKTSGSNSITSKNKLNKYIIINRTFVSVPVSGKPVSDTEKTQISSVALAYQPTIGEDPLAISSYDLNAFFELEEEAQLAKSKIESSCHLPIKEEPGTSSEQNVKSPTQDSSNGTFIIKEEPINYDEIDKLGLYGKDIKHVSVKEEKDLDETQDRTMDSENISVSTRCLDDPRLAQTKPKSPAQKRNITEAITPKNLTGLKATIRSKREKKTLMNQSNHETNDTRPFQCRFCPRTFFLDVSLQNHMSSKHKKYV